MPYSVRYLFIRAPALPSVRFRLGSVQRPHRCQDGHESRKPQSDAASVLISRPYRAASWPDRISLVRLSDVEGEPQMTETPQTRLAQQNILQQGQPP